MFIFEYLTDQGAAIMECEPERLRVVELRVAEIDPPPFDRANDAQAWDAYRRRHGVAP